MLLSCLRQLPSSLTSGPLGICAESVATTASSFSRWFTCPRPLTCTLFHGASLFILSLSLLNPLELTDTKRCFEWVDKSRHFNEEFKSIQSNLHLQIHFVHLSFIHASFTSLSICEETLFSSSITCFCIPRLSCARMYEEESKLFHQATDLSRRKERERTSQLFSTVVVNNVSCFDWLSR